MTRRAILLVLDGVGAGAAHDAERYGDVGSDTLGNVARAVGGLHLPALAALGLGNATRIQGVPPVDAPQAAFGTMQPRSAGKDSTTGHWELAGLELARAFPTYPRGFPTDLVDAISARIGRPLIGNVVGSGTAVIDTFAAMQRETGGIILYTSADSVFQLAAHEGVVPLEELYAVCATARAMLVAPHDVSRVIARPYLGEPGHFVRTANRRDYSLEAPGETLVDALAVAGIRRDGVGKVDDLFAGRHLSARHTASNAEGIAAIRQWLETAPDGFLFANLVDFDQLYGHRNDVIGFAGALAEFDRALPTLRAALREDDLLCITADHGNDPTTPSTDHARERVPVLITGARVRPAPVGERETFADLGATIADWLGVSFRGSGRSFLPSLLTA
ncbi:MAG: phosphopentomutase [Gemmatimonadaceae bacterium]|jgi:phosphopentomutase|nr:phosphopentomutase [Gemmatimonadaceae bacterium]